MTSVQGPIHPHDRADQLPPDRLAELVRERRRWLWSEGYGLLQLLDRMAEEAPCWPNPLATPMPPPS